MSWRFFGTALTWGFLFVCVHIFLLASNEQVAHKKAPSCGEEVRAMLWHRFYSYIPTRSSFDTAYRKRLFASATLCKPLIRERLLHPKKLLWKQSGSGLCVSREPHLPRILTVTHYIMLFHVCQSEFICICIYYDKINFESFQRLNIAFVRNACFRRWFYLKYHGSPKAYTNQ